MLLAQLVVEYVADLSDLEAGTQKAIDQANKVGNAVAGPQKLGQGFTQAAQHVASFSTQASHANSTSSALASAQAKAAVAASRVKEAEASAALAIKRVDDLQASGKASAEQIALAQARAATAADRVKVAEASAASAFAKAASTSQTLASTETHTVSVTDMLSSAMDRAHSSAGNMRTGLASTIAKTVEFGSHLTNLVSGLWSFAQMALEAGQNLLKPAANMEQLEGSLAIFTGSVKRARDELADLAAFSAKTPFETETIDLTAIKMQSVGIAANKVQPYILALGDVIDAIGRTSSADLEQITNAFVKIKTQGHLTGEVMQSFADMGVDAWGILEKQTGKTHEALQQMITDGVYKANDAMRDLTVGIENNPLYRGQMANDANVLNGALSTLKSGWNNLVRAFGTPVIKVLETGVQSLIGTVSNPKFQEFATTLGTQVAGGIARVGELTAQIIPGLQSLAGWAQQVATAFQSPAFQNMVLAFQNLANTISVTLGPQLKPLAADLQSIFSNEGASTGAAVLASAFQTVADAINGLNSFVIFMRDQVWPTVWPVLVQIGSFLTSTFGPSFAQVGNILQTQLMPQLAQLWTALQPLLAFLGGVFLVVLGLVIANFAAFVGAIAGALPGIITWISGLVQAFTGVVQFFTGIVMFIYDLFTGNFSRLGADLGTIWSGITNMFFGGINMIKGLFMAGLGWVTGFISGWWQAIVGYFTNLYNVLVGHSIVPDLINSIVAWFAGLPGKALAFVSRLISMAIGYFTTLAVQGPAKAAQLVSGFIGKLAQLPGQAGAKAQEAVNFIQNKLSGLAGQAASWGASLIQAFINGMGSMLAAVGQKAGEIMQKAKDFLAPGSPTKEGPGRSLMTWGPKLARYYAEGIAGGAHDVARAANTLMSPLTALSGGHGVSIGVSGSGVGVSPVSASSGGSGSSGRGGSQTVIIQFDGREIGRFVNDFQKRELRAQAVVRK